MKETEEYFHAFPIVVPSEVRYSQPGMSLRDYFAGQALVGLITRRFSEDDIVAHSFRMADLMMAQRAKVSTDA